MDVVVGPAFPPATSVAVETTIACRPPHIRKRVAETNPSVASLAPAENVGFQRPALYQRYSRHFGTKQSGEMAADRDLVFLLRMRETCAGETLLA